MTSELIDYDDIDGDDEVRKPDDLAGTFVGFFRGINYKFYFFLFIIFMLLTSDVFIDKVLGNINGATDYRNTTVKGTLIQGIILVFATLAINMIIDLGYL